MSNNSTTLSYPDPQNLTVDSTIRLHDGVEMPIFGLGVYEMNDAETEQSVTWALEAGYKLIDTAEWYENERPAGRAFRTFLKNNPSISRSALFFETKLMHNRGKEATRKAIEKSLEECGLEYIDLYLLHSPLGGPTMRRESWEAALEAKKAGRIRSIGVSNFGVNHLKELVEARRKEDWPSVNQVDLHPFMTRTDIVGYCRDHGIALQAWAPLVRGLRFSHPTVTALATRHGKSPAQVLLRWSVQTGYAAIPKSTHQNRIVENTGIFGWALSDDEMKELNALDEFLVTDWEVTTVE
ncbi:NADP-dependent oxidoreductase domain-containing protein [Gautieria morchelliformis]|nr:NADP-dependent oxidoreductase domain-containing protein [Gautieria morchelliformis]